MEAGIDPISLAHPQGDPGRRGSGAPV